MRHILWIAAFLITFLAPSLALAESQSHPGEGGGNRDMMGANNQRQNSALLRKERKAFNKAYEALAEADKTKFQDVVKSAVGEDMLAINQSQLVGFVSFVSANPTSSCSVINATREDMKSAFSLLGKKQKKSERGHASSGEVGSNIKPALMCIAGEVKKLFTGLPATTLNKFYNSNIQLASETSGTTSTTPTTASTQPSTSYGAYMTQSLNDAQGKPVENTVFTEQSIPTQRGPASADNTEMHFSGAGVSQ